MNTETYEYTIKRLESSSDPDYLSSIKIYNSTTPYEIKTSTNEITLWIDKKADSSTFEPLFFSLYFNRKNVGFAMMSYIKTTRIVVIDYIALDDNYRVNTVFFSYVTLLEKYLVDSQYDISYIINEVSNKNSGTAIDKESQLFSKILCIEGFGKIDGPYITPPLGNGNYESSFDAHIFAKSAGNVYPLEKQTYLNIVHSIYYDYFLTWYMPILTSDELNQYKKSIDYRFEKISKQLTDKSIISIIHANCPLISENCITQKTDGIPAAEQKNMKWVYIILILLVIICPIVIAWGYNIILTAFEIPIDSVSGLIGNCLGAMITACVTLCIAKKKL